MLTNTDHNITNWQCQGNQRSDPMAGAYELQMHSTSKPHTPCDRRGAPLCGHLAPVRPHGLALQQSGPSYKP